MHRLDPHVLQQFRQQVRQLICANIRNTQGIQDVADHFGITCAALCHRWTRSGETLSLGRFIGQVRLRTALAIHEALPTARCKEIALEAGYQSVDVASRAFKRTKGRSMQQLFRTNATSA